MKKIVRGMGQSLSEKQKMDVARLVPPQIVDQERAKAEIIEILSAYYKEFDPLVTKSSKKKREWLANLSMHSRELIMLLQSELSDFNLEEKYISQIKELHSYAEAQLKNPPVKGRSSDDAIYNLIYRLLDFRKKHRLQYTNKASSKAEKTNYIKWIFDCTSIVLANPLNRTALNEKIKKISKEI